ncbi:MAG: hypothetical protein CVV39_07960 [Planctomycetes bacterium HGW-Planctomycetes-1]|nr:MAG: hypothetical protein CVV39_07960 [Planctomycetes bacterium HGW-Planctomycetes-1]
MYNLINNYIDIIIKNISEQEILTYVWLLQNAGQVNTLQYQQRYKQYWGMNNARLSEEFCDAYFGLLGQTLDNPQNLNVADIARALYETPVNAHRQNLQFSFSSKLAHMANPGQPIYDSLVADFYFFKTPQNRDWQQKLEQYMLFYNFLVNEYARISREGLLNASIQQFGNQFNQPVLTDARVVDLLIWAFVKLLKQNSVLNGLIIYL